RAEGGGLPAGRIANEGVVDGEPGGAGGGDEACAGEDGRAVGATEGGEGEPRLLADRDGDGVVGHEGWALDGAGRGGLGEGGGPADIAGEGVHTVEARDPVATAGDDEERIVGHRGRGGEPEAVAEAPDDGAGHDVERV